MKTYFVFIVLFVVSACSTNNDYRPEKYLSPKEQDKLMMDIIRYVGKRPDHANDSTRFLSSYDQHYLEQAAKHKLALYFEDERGMRYFLVTRPAPSIYEKYVATGGKLLYGENGRIAEYEEVFRTWKLQKDTLASRSLILFGKMVKGEPLDAYLTKNANGVEYIEFPDDNVYYDKISRSWKSRLYGSVEEMVNPN
jgi:hypothetical protein